MGHDGFGQFAYSKNIITYNISPFEQKAFAGVTSNGFLNVWRRFSTKALISLPPLMLCYWAVGHMNSQHAVLARKNPAEFENEVFEEM